VVAFADRRSPIADRRSPRKCGSGPREEVSRAAAAATESSPARGRGPRAIVRQHQPSAVANRKMSRVCVCVCMYERASARSPILGINPLAPLAHSCSKIGSRMTDFLRFVRTRLHSQNREHESVEARSARPVGFSRDLEAAERAATRHSSSQQAQRLVSIMSRSFCPIGISPFRETSPAAIAVAGMPRDRVEIHPIFAEATLAERHGATRDATRPFSRIESEWTHYPA